jgi:hypothetical protein
MNRITKTLAVAGLILLIISCKKEMLPDNSLAKTDPANSLANRKLAQLSLQKLFVSGLGGGVGSTIGPGGDLFVPDSKAGTILRIDPKTGNYTIFASGLPQLIPAVDPRIGGVSDVAFLGGKAYALVTLVDDPLFPTGQVNGIYQIDGPNSYTIIADIGAFNIAIRQPASLWRL